METPFVHTRTAMIICLDSVIFMSVFSVSDEMTWLNTMPEVR